MKILLNKVLKLLIFLTIIHDIKCDYYTSVVGLEDLLDVESIFINGVNEYLNNVKKVNEQIEGFLDEIQQEQEIINKNPNKYFQDPINAFKIIKRFVVDWPHMADRTNFKPEFEAYNKSITLPAEEYTPVTAEDLRGAARGLKRLQKMYKLETGDLVEGYIKDLKLSEDLTAHDCFIMGKSLYESKEYLYASDWFMEALQQLDIMKQLEEQLMGNETNKETNAEYPYVTQVDILEYLGAALYNAGNRKLANLFNRNLLLLDPENKYGLANKELFENGIVAERRARIIKNKQTEKSKAEDLYNKVCSGELQQTPKEKRTLRCRYVTNNVPFYFIGPFKMEELNHEPFVVYYHQVIYDGEIKQIKEEVEGLIERSKVGTTASSHVNEIRTSQNSWLWYEHHEFLAAFYDRLEDMTGLSMISGEALQVANYGIGGHYGPHYDFSDEPDSDYGGKGNRISTALFYINDVEMGGATAFPYLRLAVPAIKYSAVVWFNMHKSLEPDYRTRHAGCPVLKGSKWICNEWFHEVGQEFKRPCDLKPDGELSIAFKNKV